MLLDASVIILGPPPAPRAGRHRLAGVVTVDGIQAARAIVVLNRRSLLWVAGTLSNPITGEWEITGVLEHPERSLIVVALDNTGNYNAEVADYVSQVTA